MKVVLLGYMGSGKSTIGRLLAQRLDHVHYDLDDYIENKEGQKIKEIFEKKGEIYFRKKESFYLSQVLNANNNIVLSLGGGTPCYGNNMDELLRLTDNVLHLHVSVAELAKRLQKEKSTRPLIMDIPDADLPEFIGKHLFERSAFYQEAKTTIYCNGKNVEDIVDEIEKRLV